MYARQLKGSRRKWQVIVSWSLFAAGLLVQPFAPHLKVSDGVFVLPDDALSDPGKTISPAEIVRKERIMQGLSALLVAGGALGLAFLYRDLLFRRASREAAEPPGYTGDRSSDGERHRTSTTEESQTNKRGVST